MHISKPGSVLKLNALENLFEVTLSIQLKFALYSEKTSIKHDYSDSLNALQQSRNWNTRNF